MADVEQIKQDIADLQAAESGAVSELEALADQVAQLKDAGASAVTDDQLEELHNNLQAVTSGLVEATQSASGGGQAAPPDAGGAAPDAGGGDVAPGAGAPDTAPAAAPDTGAAPDTNPAEGAETPAEAPAPGDDVT